MQTGSPHISLLVVCTCLPDCPAAGIYRVVPTGWPLGTGLHQTSLLEVGVPQISLSEIGSHQHDSAKPVPNRFARSGSASRQDDSPESVIPQISPLGIGSPTG